MKSGRRTTIRLQNRLRSYGLLKVGFLEVAGVGFRSPASCRLTESPPRRYARSCAHIRGSVRLPPPQIKNRAPQSGALGFLEVAGVDPPRRRHHGALLRAGAFADAVIPDRFSSPSLGAHARSPPATSDKKPSTPMRGARFFGGGGSRTRVLKRETRASTGLGGF